MQQLQQLQHKKKTNKILRNKCMKHLRKRLKTLENYCKHIQHTHETLANICMKHLKIYACNMHAYICNIQIKHLQHTSGKDETFGTYT